ncbi:hypothetical protein [Kozakia baliensis]|nr:hypothetical protein [Kozakia baliensis]
MTNGEDDLIDWKAILIISALGSFIGLVMIAAFANAGPAIELVP